MPLHTGKGRTVGTAITDILDYVENPQKTDNGRLITGFQCDSRVADAEFLFTKRQYATLTGRTRGGDVIAYHVRQSFVPGEVTPGEVTPEEVNRIGVEFANRFNKGNHAFIVCTHIDKEHIHNHIIWNSTALDYKRKFRNFWGSTRAVRRFSDTLCIENCGEPNRHGKKYNKWLGDRKKPFQREALRSFTDEALEQKPAQLTPEKRVNLLVDIQEKLRAGKAAAEKRLAEIAVLRTHIINYSKTRDVYIAYRKAGYSKKFKAELLLHQTAKKAFDELVVKKLPTVKSLQAEYAALLAEKKEAYGDYRKARDEMKELLTVKANVDRLISALACIVRVAEL